jgi:hypothetical protein
MGAHISLAPLYGYSPHGKRAFFEVPRNRGKNTALLASIGCGGLYDQEVFEVYIERFLTPMLGEGQVVVIDNLSAQKGARM